jgi:predicted PhzF superfamily epimerase YddE/YHI9
MKLRQRFTQVDAFTGEAFGGNPAAVFLLPTVRDAGWMQLVAREMNLAATAFLLRREEGFDLRWFTPACEVDLCGHATLASAHMLWEQEHLPTDQVARFHTRSGLLTAERRNHMIWLDFPATPATPADPPAELSQGLGRSGRFVGRTRFDYLVELESETAVRTLTPDLSVLGRVAARGIIVTAKAATSEYDFVSRFFGPAAGIPEDPATGSAHCALAPYWSSKLGRTELLGYQASPRGGTIQVRMAGERVKLGGEAVTVLKGELLS